MPRVTWSSTASLLGDEQSDPDAPRDLDVLIAEWHAAKDKGAYISSLPLCEASALCAVAKERLPSSARTRGHVE